MNNLPKLWLRRYKYYILTVLGAAVIIGCTALLTPSAPKQSGQTRSADSFVDSIGVNTHLYYDNTVYYKKYNEIIKPRLQELGVRHIRDGAVINSNRYYSRLRDLDTIGIRVDLIADPREINPGQAVKIIKKLNNVVEAVEGPNEYDASGNSKWADTLRSYQQSLYKEINTQVNSKLPILGPSLIRSESYSKVGELTAYLDYGNLHPYPGGRWPETKGWGPGGYGSLKYNIKLARKLSQRKPIIVTETGYHNATNSTENWAQQGISETAAGKYIPRLFLECFNSDISRTYGYEFIDLRKNSKKNKSESNYGLLHNDGSPKLAFITLKNLISLLKDPGDSFPLKSLDYTLSGDTKNVRHILLQKRDGTFYLVLWLSVPSYDLKSKRELSVPKQTVTLNLKTPISKAATYLPNSSTTQIEEYTSFKTLQVKVPDHPLIIKFVSAIG